MGDKPNEGLFRLELEEISERVKGCVKCRLSENRNKAVPGEGDPEANLLFVGEGPGRQEDQQGRPFVGRAGDKLTEILGSVSLDRSQVYITNVVNVVRPKIERQKRTR